MTSHATVITDYNVYYCYNYCYYYKHWYVKHAFFTMGSPCVSFDHTFFHNGYKVVDSGNNGITIPSYKAHSCNHRN